MIHKIAGTFLITLSILCMLLSAAPFTPTVIVSLILIGVAGIYGAFKQSVIATALLCFSTLSVMLSPVINVEGQFFWFFLPTYFFGFGCTVWGLMKRKP